MGLSFKCVFKRRTKRAEKFKAALVEEETENSTPFVGQRINSTVIFP